MKREYLTLNNHLCEDKDREKYKSRQILTFEIRECYKVFGRIHEMYIVE